MKRLLLAFTLSLTFAALSFQAQAQGYFNQAKEGEIKWGIRGGANYFNLGQLDFMDVAELEEFGITALPSITTKYKIGFQIGGYADIWMSHSFSFMPELNFIRKGAKLNQTIKFNLSDFIPDSPFPLPTLEIDANLNSEMYYAEAPLLLGFRPIPSITIMAGPQISYLLYHKSRSTDTAPAEDEEPMFEDGDDEIIGTEGLKKVVIGATAGVQVDITPKINITARYARDLGSAAESDQNQKKFRNSGFALSLGYSF